MWALSVSWFPAAEPTTAGPTHQTSVPQAAAPQPPAATPRLSHPMSPSTTASSYLRYRVPAAIASPVLCRSTPRPRPSSPPRPFHSPPKPESPPNHSAQSTPAGLPWEQAAVHCQTAQPSARCAAPPKPPCRPRQPAHTVLRDQAL